MLNQSVDANEGVTVSASEGSKLYKTEIPHLRYAPVRNDKVPFSTPSATGGLTVPKGKEDSNWRRYVAWKLEAFKKVRQAVCDVIHKHRPEVVVSFNWAYTQRQPEVVPDGADSEDVGGVREDPAASLQQIAMKTSEKDGARKMQLV